MRTGGVGALSYKTLTDSLDSGDGARGWTENTFKHIKKKWVKYNMKTPARTRARKLRQVGNRWVDSDDDEEPGVHIQVCGDPDCSMEGDLPMIQCMGPGCSSQYHRCCAGIQESETEDAVEEWFCDEDCRVNAGRGRKKCGGTEEMSMYT
ncbi:hypothetical protein B0H10DRAFT_2184863 [Mycena sp. CBHHK59/15]|nr:hypothetical protein B0H10DRAFT_2184863 [Mycena sp. CBHHK59/15]